MSTTTSTPAKNAQAANLLKPAGTCLAILLFLVGLNLLWKSFGIKPGDEWRRTYLPGIILIGSGLGLAALAWGLLNPPQPGAELAPWKFYTTAALSAAFVVLSILHYGMYQIGGYDYGYMIDIAWRLIHGDELYKDIPCTTPISFVLGSKFALQWFGISWRSFVEILALFSFVTYAWSLWLLSRLFGRNWKILLWAVALQIMSPLVVGSWTYNATADIASLVYALSAMYWFRRPADKAALASYGFSLWLLATMKPNSAGTLIIGMSAILFFSAPHRWKLLAVSAIAFLLFLLFLTANHVSFSAMIHSYLSVRSRATSLVPFLHDLNPFEGCMGMLELLALLLPAVLILSLGRDAKVKPLSVMPAVAMAVGYGIFACNPTEFKAVGEATIFIPVILALLLGWKSLFSLSVWIPVVALLGALYSFVTNSDQKVVDLPPIVMAAILVAAELRSRAGPSPNALLQLPASWTRCFSLACVVLGSVGLAQATSRDRVRSIGPFFEFDNSHYITDGFFKGVHCGPILEEMLKEIDFIISKNPTATVWFGPRMEWGYAAFNKPSPKDAPVQWDRAMYDPTKESYYFDNFLKRKTQVLICFKNDLTNYSQDEIQQMTQEYNVVQSFPCLTVLVLKQ